jgi:hypothetical protein
MGRGNVARRRRRHRAGVAGLIPYDRVPDKAIYERDGWACQMPACTCPSGRAIDPELASPHKWSASIDHIIPLGEGGPDTADNKRAAHTRCNVRANGRRWQSRARQLTAGKSGKPDVLPDGGDYWQLDNRSLGLPDDAGEFARFYAVTIGPRFIRAYLRARARRRKARRPGRARRRACGQPRAPEGDRTVTRFRIHPDFGPAVCAGFWAQHAMSTAAGRMARFLLGVTRIAPPDDQPSAPESGEDRTDG